MQDNVSMLYVAAPKLCVVVDSPVKIWPSTMFSKKYHLTIVCLAAHFGTILTICFKYYFDVDKSSIKLQPSRNEELCRFPIPIENRVPDSCFGVRYLIVEDGIFMFFRTRFDILLFSDWNKCISNLYTCI